MNLREFCEDEDIQKNFEQLSIGGQQSLYFLLEKMQNLEVGYFEVVSRLSVKNFDLSPNHWGEMVEAIRDALIDKLLQNKFNYYNPQKSQLITYLTTVIVHIILQIKRNETLEMGKRRIAKAVSFDLLTELGKLDDIAKIDGKEMTCEAPYLRLKDEIYSEIQRLTCLRRTILKLWLPYFFEYKLDPDEQHLLIKCDQEIDKIQQRLREIILELLNTESKTPHVSPEIIANWLKKTRNAIDRHLTVLRTKLTWLRKGNWKDGLAEENF
ncbi:hypothetical protein [Candidatus Uabimicrobium amorphum]|uniref:Uncharacterized protein n=1 Tax=Uabimicrobium amorphum TaxID=2596890 RepID=A0A5S9F283_UABAM|nr:hypothetical protein [Candidatus Uabimicrobium amorphum]BBM83346.1 hypothetical protein UABAM_01698 [Candidatus Uabimicrobium amorphum]